MRHRSVFAALALGLAGFTLGFAADAAAQEDDPQGYRTPPDTIARIAEAPPTPGISVSPDAAHAVLTHRASLIPLAELTRPELRIAGLRLDPATSAASRRRTRNGLTLRRLRDGAASRADRPAGSAPRRPSLLVAGRRPLRFTHTEDDDVELWVAEVAGGAARRVLDEVRAMFRDAPYHWLPDGSGLVARVAVEEGAARRIFGGVGAASRLLPGSVRFAAQTARDRLGGDDGPLPTPVIQETTGRVAPVRTYQDLLTSPQDEALFLHHGTARVVTVDLDGKTEEIARPRHHPGRRSLAGRGVPAGHHDPPAVLLPGALLPLPAADRGARPRRRGGPGSGGSPAHGGDPDRPGLRPHRAAAGGLARRPGTRPSSGSRPATAATRTPKPRSATNWSSSPPRSRAIPRRSCRPRCGSPARCSAAGAGWRSAAGG